MSKEKDVDSNFEDVVSTVITPPEISKLHKRLEEADERIEFVLGEISQREGLKIGGHLGFMYGFTAGSIICVLLKFVFQLI